ncbi:MAG: lipoate--protein ligase family protein [Nitrospirae bacterium]|nr:lipoate--protein ligase family protein [Nitrospirota bacterium]
MNFARIIIQERNNAFFNMALDEAICDAVRRKLSPPTLRVYKWARPSVSIGYFQKISDIDIDYCKNNDYPVVRRLTGGRAILHDSEITYSFSAKKGSLYFNGRLRNDYTIISRALVEGLKLCGIPAEISFKRKKASEQKSPVCFKVVSYGEVTVNDRKVIGSAQKRYSDGFLQHGSILLRHEDAELKKVIRCGGREDLSGIGSISGYSDENISRRLVRALKKAFEAVLDVKMISDEPGVHELKLARELESEKYSTDRWNSLK